jgi:hypothetical protein
MRTTWADRAGTQQLQTSGWHGESANSSRPLFDKVHTVLKHVLDETGIEYSAPTRDLNLRYEPPADRAALPWVTLQRRLDGPASPAGIAPAQGR